VREQVRTLPKVLAVLPVEKAQDARRFVCALQYWLGGNPNNLESLLLMTVQAYVPDLKGVDFKVKEPELYPDVGIWHPLAPCASLPLPAQPLPHEFIFNRDLLAQLF
jgi:magnesium chelatase subunit H